MNFRPIKLIAKRKAIAMIELIFAIVIMGIVLLSVPNIISVSTQSGYISLQQEAIATAASQINLLMTKQWDENNVVDTATGITSTAILNVTNGTPSLNKPRNGAKTRTFTLAGGGEKSATPIGAEANDFDDIDDMSGTSMTLRNFSNTAVTAGDIIDTNITIATTVVYANDSTSTASDYNTSNTIQYNFNPALVPPTTNIKSITTELTTDNPAIELSKNIKLQAFTVNIGSYAVAYKDFL